jgi:tetratricopeptide (TPR) repeat protein
VLRGAHARWVEAFSRNTDKYVIGPSSAEWLERLEGEHDNVRSAITWAIDSDSHDLGLRVPESFGCVWQIRGHLAEVRRWLECALAASPEAPENLRALALDGLGNIAWRQGDLGFAVSAFEESLEIWRANDERRALGGTLTNLGNVVELQGDLDRAQALQEEALVIFRELDDPLRVATALNNLALVIWNKGGQSAGHETP